ERGSLATYAVPVARDSDAAVVPAQSRSKVWRNSGGVDLVPLPSVQLRVDAASLRDLRGYGDSTTIGRLMGAERRSLLGRNVGVETQRTINTFVGVPPQIGAWLRPRAAFVTVFSFNRDPNGRDPVRDVGDTAGGFHVPAAFANSRRVDLGVQLDPQRFGQRAFGDSAAVTRLLRRLTNLDVSYSRAQVSTYNRSPFLPALSYQLALGGFSGFRQQGGLLAGSASDNWNLNAAGNVVLLPGMRASLNYRETEGVTWALRTDQQVPIRTSSREWPSGTFSWSFAPPRSTLGRVLASVNAQLAFRTAGILKLKNDVRTTARYSHAENTVCLRLAGQTTCVPYVDSRQTQMQLSLDTDLPPTLSAGFQMAYLVNEERQANRKTSQLVITAFVELHTSVGRIQ